jgi:hypothetical protein
LKAGASVETLEEQIEQSTSSQLIKETAGELGKKVNKSTYPLFKFILHKPSWLAGAMASLGFGVFLVVWALPLFGNQCAVLLNSWAKLTYKGVAVDVGKTFSDGVETLHLPVYLNAVCFPQQPDPLMAALDIYKMPFPPFILGTALILLGLLLVGAAVFTFVNIVRTYLGKPTANLSIGRRNSDSRVSKSKPLQGLKQLQFGKLTHKTTRAIVALGLALTLILIYVLSFALPREISAPVSSPSQTASNISDTPTPANNTTSEPAVTTCDPNAPNLSSLVGVWDRKSNSNGVWGIGLWLKVVQIGDNLIEANFIQETGQLDPTVVGSARLEGNSSCFTLHWNTRGWETYDTKGYFNGTNLNVDCSDALSMSKDLNGNEIFGTEGCSFIPDPGYTSLVDVTQNFTDISKKKLSNNAQNISGNGLSITFKPWPQNKRLVPMYVATIKDYEGTVVKKTYFADLGQGAGKIFFDDYDVDIWLGVAASYENLNRQGLGKMTLSFRCDYMPGQLVGFDLPDGSATSDCNFSFADRG